MNHNINPENKVTSDMKITTIKTDVLVIGGGYAGGFAAINAAEAGANVLMAVKGRTGRSGLTPWANSFFVHHDTQGATREDYYQQFDLSGEYLCNMDFVDILIDDAYDRYLDLTEWGATTGRENYYQKGTVSRSIEIIGSGDAIRNKAVEVGVKLLERVMITSLIKPEDKVEGAIGFHTETGKAYAILAKSTIICAGPASYRPLGNGFPCSSATGDGDSMAYHAGAEISGKEFNDGHPGRMDNPFPKGADVIASGDGITKKSPLELGGGPPGSLGPVEYLHGDLIGMRVDNVADVHKNGLPFDPGAMKEPGSGTPKTAGYKTSGIPVDGGEAPLAWSGPAGPDGNNKDDGPGPGGPGGRPFTGYSTIGMSNHKAEGVFPHDTNGKSNVEGLWAAGDSLSSMQNGAGYAGFGCSSAGSSVQGARSGLAAAEAAKTCDEPIVSQAYLEEITTEMLAPMNRKKGYDPAWVTQMMQNIVYPYFITYLKEASRLEAALSQITYLQEKFIPKLRVEDAHGLRVAHETTNILLNAEMKLRAGLAREESRGTHIREDFPFRDDDNFLCWVKLVEKDGKMEVVKHPIPEKWHPDESLTYREKYMCEFEGEDAYLAKL